jgi:predicted DNA-binding transcriptional regulator AlpA
MFKDEIGTYPLVLTAKEISLILKISKPSAYEVMNRNDFPLIKIGRCKRVLRDEFFLWLMNQQEINNNV